MRVQEGSSLHIPIHPSTASLSGFRKPGAVFDGPTCYSVQGEDNKANPPPHLNAPPLRTTNGVTTTGLKRRRIMQEQETALHQLSLSDIRKPAAALNNPVAHHRTHEEKCKSIPTPLTASKKNDVTSLGIEKCNRTQNIFLTNNSKLGRIQGSNPVFKRECKPR